MVQERNWEHDADIKENHPKAPEILNQNEQGYFLMIEGGRIDHAYHAGNAFRALSETIALSKAVHAIQSALSEEEKEDTLILVTADHSHTFTIAGIPLVETPSSGWWLVMITMATPRPHPRKMPWGFPIQSLPTRMDGVMGAPCKTISPRKSPLAGFISIWISGMAVGHCRTRGLEIPSHIQKPSA